MKDATWWGRRPGPSWKSPPISGLWTVPKSFFLLEVTRNAKQNELWPCSDGLLWGHLQPFLSGTQTSPFHDVISETRMVLTFTSPAPACWKSALTLRKSTSEHKSLICEKRELVFKESIIREGWLRRTVGGSPQRCFEEVGVYKTSLISFYWIWKSYC